MLCNNCHKDIPADSQFCPWCGSNQSLEKELENADSENSASEDNKTHLLQHNDSKNFLSSRIFRIAVVVVVLIVLGVSFGIVNSNKKKAAAAVSKKAQIEKEISAANSAINGVGKTYSATQVGVTEENYSKVLAESAASVEAYNPTDSKGILIRQNLDSAIGYYKVAVKAWNNSSDYRSTKYEWTKRYPDLDLGTDSFPNDPYFSDVVSSDEVAQAAWVAASNYYLKAKELASKY